MVKKSDGWVRLEHRVVWGEKENRGTIPLIKRYTSSSEGGRSSTRQYQLTVNANAAF